VIYHVVEGKPWEGEESLQPHKEQKDDAFLPWPLRAPEKVLCVLTRVILKEVVIDSGNSRGFSSQESESIKAMKITS